jgi:hypothetical protein
MGHISKTSSDGVNKELPLEEDKVITEENSGSWYLQWGAVDDDAGIG